MEGIYERGKKSTAQIRKIQVLQGLRGIAFLLIFISHCNYRLNSYGRNIFTWLGGLGVSIFIMLSGYLLMENHHSDSLNAIEYLKKKLKKVYPLHILTLIMALPLTIGGVKTIKYWIALFQNLALVQSWSTDWEIYFSFNAVAWYLSIYVFFILISPLVIRVLNGMEPYFFLLVGGIIGFEFVWCFFVQNKSIAHWLIYICPIVRSMDYFLGGIWLLQQKKKCSLKICHLLLAIVVCVDIVFTYISMNSVSEFFSSSVWCVPTFILIYLLVVSEGRSSLINFIFGNKMVVLIGNISFELFLIHQLVIKYLDKIYSRLGIPGTFLNYVVALILSIIIAYVYKMLFNKVVRKM